VGHRKTWLLGRRPSPIALASTVQAARDEATVTAAAASDPSVASASTSAAVVSAPPPPFDWWVVFTSEFERSGALVGCRCPSALLEGFPAKGLRAALASGALQPAPCPEMPPGSPPAVWRNWVDGQWEFCLALLNPRVGGAAVAAQNQLLDQPDLVLHRLPEEPAGAAAEAAQGFGYKCWLLGRRLPGAAAMVWTQLPVVRGLYRGSCFIGLRASSTLLEKVMVPRIFAGPPAAPMPELGGVPARWTSWEDATGTDRDGGCTASHGGSSSKTGVVGVPTTTSAQAALALTPSRTVTTYTLVLLNPDGAWRTASASDRDGGQLGRFKRRPASGSVSVSGVQNTQTEGTSSESTDSGRTVTE
jgi:hypothetical protein